MAISLEGISESDLKRFAACWLCSDMQTDWAAASAIIDPEGKVKLASFKTMSNRAAKKAGAGGDGEGGAKKAAGGKRNKAAGEDGEDTAPKKRGKAVPKGKKSEETVNEEEDGLPVKSEASAGEEE